MIARNFLKFPEALRFQRELFSNGYHNQPRIMRLMECVFSWIPTVPDWWKAKKASARALAKLVKKAMLHLFDSATFCGIFCKGVNLIMELEIYNAFIKAGVPEAEAKAAVESINREIDKRYTLHAAQLVTKNDLAEAKLEIIKWSIGTMFAAVGLFATITKLWQ